MTICLNCGNRVHTAPGFCEICGEVFCNATLDRNVVGVIITPAYQTKEEAPAERQRASVSSASLVCISALPLLGTAAWDRQVCNQGLKKSA
jgi:hypothetical protein